ncbi:MAG: site-2 protease family protein [Fimbriimonadaceae bacterium]|nr:site-2 protease family protein [Fimbriimonadaceae bacterium]
MEIPPIEQLIPLAIVIFLAIGLHEYAHCKMADAAGDPTPGIHGRVTLNLTKHFELVGTLVICFTMLSGYGIGWGKPAPMDPRKMRNPRWDFFAAVAAGPITNLLQASVYAMGIRLLLAGGNPHSVPTMLYFLLLYGVLCNLGLFVFNLIPLGPLDGHWLVGLLMPDRMQLAWYRFNRQVGTFLLLGLVLLGRPLIEGLKSAGIVPLTAPESVFGIILGAPIDFLFRFLTGFAL